jgi:hypothetical protein
MKLDSLLKSGMDFCFPRRHLFPGSAIDNVDLTRPQAKSRPGGVNGYSATANDSHAFPFHIGDFTQGHIFQELRSMVDPWEILACDPKPATLMGSYGQNNRAETLFVEEAVHGDVFSQFLIELDVNACPFDVLDLDVEDLPGKTVLGNPDRHPTACDG